MNKKYLDWRDVEQGVERLATNITASKIEFTAVTGLPRGGLIPAIMLSHTLSVPFISQPPNQVGSSILVVDDICDSGVTMQKFKDVENIYTVTLHYKTTACYEPNYWWRLVGDNEWIVYPWERKDSQTIPDYATKRE